MEHMHHNGVLVPPKYEGDGLTIRVKGETIELNEDQEEMALSWTKKIGTPYVDDPEFAENFHKDFSDALGKEVMPGDVDFSFIHKRVVEERERKANLSSEEKKRQREERKAIRNANKERYGWVTVDGERMEIANYMVEPSSIFMGRGEHPLRGRWKEGPRHENVELNLSPDAPIPPGKWQNIVWEPESVWIARWRDKLSGKMKYVWLHDSSPLKQEKDIEKFDKARELKDILPEVQEYIFKNLTNEDLQRRKTATVTFLIDHCKFRVGDEKDEDEAETIGASTLRPEHIGFNGDGTVTFDFLGKDSVRHVLCVKMPQKVIDNLKEFSEEAEEGLFNGVDSKRVSEFLDEIYTGLSAKVFRTHYSSTAVESKLREIRVDPEDPDYRKKHVATLANLEAAKICNHKRTIPKTWTQSLKRQKERLGERRERATRNVVKYREKIKETEKRYRDRITRYKEKLKEDEKRLEDYKRELEERKAEGRATKGIKNRIASKKRVIKNGKDRILKNKKKLMERLATLKERMENRKRKDNALIEKTELRIEAKELTRDYNLNTSLKSYIDPRIYHNWGKKVDYDWKDYYSKSLCSKFSWVEPQEKRKGES